MPIDGGRINENKSGSEEAVWVYSILRNSLCMYIYIYIYTYVFMYVCMCIYIDIHAPCTHTCVRSHPEISSSARIQRGHCCENPRKKPEIETHGFQQIFPSIHSLKGFLGLVLDLPYRFWTTSCP